MCYGQDRSDRSGSYGPGYTLACNARSLLSFWICPPFWISFGPANPLLYAHANDDFRWTFHCYHVTQYTYYILELLRPIFRGGPVLHTNLTPPGPILYPIRIVPCFMLCTIIVMRPIDRALGLSFRCGLRGMALLVRENQEYQVIIMSLSFVMLLREPYIRR